MVAVSAGMSKKISEPASNLTFDFAPMEAKLVKAIPADDGNWQYEPKWDGFRCIAFRQPDGTIEMRSKSGQPLARYFPELVDALKNLKANEFVIDGEIVIQNGDHFDFDSLLQRIHPAQSRINKLSKETPASYIVFDLLKTASGKNIYEEPLAKRRNQLESFAQANFSRDSDFTLSPCTMSFDDAQKWLSESGAITDGVIAKRIDMSYQSGNRNGMVKVKRLRTVDCVVGGFRYNAGSKVVGSLLLGLYDSDGELHHVGFTSSLSADEKKELTPQLEKLKAAKSFTQNIPGKPSRWSSERSAEWVPLKTKLVVEITYDHFTGGRFRHATRLLRWRPEKAPRSCTLDQIDN